MTSAEFAAVAAAIVADAQTIVSRLSALKADIDTLHHLAHGIVAVTGPAVTAAQPEGTRGTLAAHVEVGPDVAVAV
jgi:hypothetical protein